MPGPEMNLLLVAVKKDDTCDQSGWMNGRCNNVVAFLFSFCSVGVCFAAMSKPHGTVSPCVQRSVKCLAMTSRRMVRKWSTNDGPWSLEAITLDMCFDG